MLLPSCAQLEALPRGCSVHGVCVCELRSQQGAAQPLPVLPALLGELTPIYLSWVFSVLNRRVHLCIPAAARVCICLFLLLIVVALLCQPVTNLAVFLPLLSLPGLSCKYPLLQGSFLLGVLLHTTPFTSIFIEFNFILTIF